MEHRQSLYGRAALCLSLSLSLSPGLWWGVASVSFFLSLSLSLSLSLCTRWGSLSLSLSVSVFDRAALKAGGPGTSRAQIDNLMEQPISKAHFERESVRQLIHIRIAHKKTCRSNTLPLHLAFSFRPEFPLSKLQVFMDCFHGPSAPLQQASG